MVGGGGGGGGGEGSLGGGVAGERSVSTVCGLAGQTAESGVGGGHQAVLPPSPSLLLLSSAPHSPLQGGRRHAG